MVVKFLYKYALKPILFLQDPEKVHDAFTIFGSFLAQFKLSRAITSLLFNYKNDILKQNIAGIDFSNPVGLSAGFDKEGKLPVILSEIGFGFTQVGSVTKNPYAGNPGKRLHRLKKSKALTVYYGLKNEGADAIISRLKKNKVNTKIPISISIAKKNASYTKNQEAGITDYFDCLESFEKSDVSDFYTINISCPNTFGGEPFTDPDSLDALLKKLFSKKISKPVFIKMPVDLDTAALHKLLDVILKYNVAGVVLSNLTKNRDADTILDPIPEHIKGGISGKPTQELSDALIAETYRYCGEKLMIIGVGGIFSAEDAYTKIKNGASLVQLITGMIYEGPTLISEINRGLVKLLLADGYTHISEAIGANINTSK